jgi:hypothetical protein
MNNLVGKAFSDLMRWSHIYGKAGPLKNHRMFELLAMIEKKNGK